MTYSDRAQFDLEDVWLFSATAWGGAQADDYIASVVGTLKRAAAQPGRLRRSAISPYRIVSCRSHRAYVRITEEGLFVARVLHTSMNEGDHLP